MMAISELLADISCILILTIWADRSLDGLKQRVYPKSVHIREYPVTVPLHLTVIKSAVPKSFSLGQGSYRKLKHSLTGLSKIPASSHERQGGLSK